MKTNVCVILAAGLMFGACSNDNDPTADSANGVAAVFSTNLDARVQTRMADEAWGNGDAIGIFSLSDEMSGVTTDGVAASANIATNLKYTRTSGGAWDGGTTAFRFKNPAAAVVSFKAYYPYKADADITADATAGLKEGTIAVDVTDQSAAGQTAYDFLYSDKDKAGVVSKGDKNNPNVNFQFTHSMAKIIVKFVPDGTSVTTLPADMSPALMGLKTKGTFSLKEGKVTVSGGVATLALKNKTTSGTEQSFVAIVPPQTTGTEGISLSILANNSADQYLTAKIMQSYELKAANSYTITLTVKKKELVVAASDVTAWAPNDDAGSSDAILQ